MGFFFKSRLLEAHDHMTLSLFFLFFFFFNNKFLILPVAGKSLKMLSKCTARLRNQMPNNKKPNCVAIFKSLKF